MVSTQRKGGLILANIIKDTMVNSPKAVHMRGLEGLLSQTTGVPRERPIMDGVIASTVPSHMRDVPELHPVPASEQGKTDSKMAVGRTYPGPKSGYGGGGGHAEKRTKTK
jgi:hypothetical protein